MSRFKLVALESPYGSDDPKVIEENVEYGRKCMRDCILRGEAPFASHLLYTQPGVLDDSDPEERKLGIEMGCAVEEKLDYTVVYIDRGISKGMLKGMMAARTVGRRILIRSLALEMGWVDI